jgi:hypothetical protein
LGHEEDDLKLLFSTLTMAAALTVPAFAGAIFTPCPIPNGGNSGGFTVAGSYAANTAGGTANGCNVLITFNADGSVVTTNPNGAGFYDSGSDDNLVGVINNTNAAITTIALSSSLTIFGFETDGICGAPGYTFSDGAGGSVANNLVCTSTDSSGYGGPSVTFSPNAGNTSGLVNFGNGGIAANGGTAWFSLEEPVDLNLQVTQGAPEPASVALIISGLGAVAFARRRRSVR